MLSPEDAMAANVEALKAYKERFGDHPYQVDYVRFGLLRYRPRRFPPSPESPPSPLTLRMPAIALAAGFMLAGLLVAVATPWELLGGMWLGAGLALGSITLRRAING